MKILFLVPYIHVDGYPGLERFNVGAAFTFRSIVNELGKNNDISVYVQCGKYKSGEKDNVKYIGKGIHSIIRPSVFYFKKLIKAIKMEEQLSISRALHYAYYYLAGPQIESIIKKIKPDVVSIRSGDFSTEACILACERQHVKYVISSHGLSCTVNDGSIRKSIQELEKENYRICSRKNIPMTVISSGMKKRITELLQLRNSDNIYVVLNGVDEPNMTNSTINEEDIRKQYCITAGDKVIISAGSISTRKNQTQIVRAYGLLSPELRSNTKLLILGSGSDDRIEELKREIDRIEPPNNICYCGFVTINNVSKFFDIADVNVISSIDEGFGRAFIEGFLAGIPSVTFSDLDAVDDLYDDNVMVKVDNRSDEDLSKGIEYALNKKWDAAYIKEYAKRFSVSSMATNYLEIYKMVSV